MKNWIWFFVAIILMIVFTNIYIRFTSLIYNTSAIILIKDPNNLNKTSEFAAFSDVSPIPINSNAVSDELEFFKSKKLISKVVNNLNLNVVIYKNNIRKNDVYGITPLEANFEKNIGARKLKAKEYKFNVISNTEYELIDQSSNVVKGFFDTPLNVNNGILTLTLKNNISYNDSKLKNLILKLYSNDAYTSFLQKKIDITLKDKGSSIVKLSTNSSNKLKNENILNSLIDQYNKNAVEKQNIVAKNTANFIEDRLSIISQELDNVELNKVSFKKRNNITNISSEANLFIEKFSDSKSKLDNYLVQLDLIKSTIKYLQNIENDQKYIPNNIALRNIELNNLILNYNNLLFEWKELAKFSTEENPLVINLSNEIESKKEILLRSLEGEKDNQLVIIKEAKKAIKVINNKILSIPNQEKEFRVIERQQNLKEELYLFLLQKREETSLSMARKEPMATIVDSAFSSDTPLYPKSRVLYLGGIILGFLIPFLTIYAKDQLNTKINDKLELESLLKEIPILGELPKVKSEGIGVITKNDRSILGESFRVLRSNLNYFLKIKSKEKDALKIFVTSTIKGEGKTFVAYNTALSLVEASKKVLLVGADIRNPQLHRYLNVNKKLTGISEFLYDDEIEIDTILNTIEVNGSTMDFILSGAIPPNPSELLINGRFNLLLDQLELSYDYIIIDTAPTMLVADTLSICDIADVMMYVVRAGFTDKNLASYIYKLQNEGKISNVTLVLNDVKESNIGYGYSYGYGEYNKRSFWNRIGRS
ncbi:GumC family protein [Aquimarina agarivorans]|uniref:GumC family protein n=1 Tax=Aquimarina agarivorans TaxID=980584 RepID=UPI003F693D74